MGINRDINKIEIKSNIKQVDSIAIDATLTNGKSKRLTYNFKEGSIDRERATIKFEYGNKSKCTLTFDFKGYELTIKELNNHGCQFMKSKIRVFGRNKDGKIEFTSEELEELLNEVYTDGYNDGNNYTLTSPTIDGSKITCASKDPSLTTAYSDGNKFVYTETYDLN